MIDTPLRLSRERIILYGGALTVICLAQVRFVVAQGYGDWSPFWAAGATAGTPDLLNPHAHVAWLKAHHLLTTIFPYLPGAAWFFVPFRSLSLPAGYAMNFVVMFMAATLASVFATRTYRISQPVAAVLVFAWAPVTAALSTGQNSPLGLLLAMAAIYALAFNAPLIAALAIGALLYKWTYALPLVVLLLVRRQYRAVAIVAGCAGVWYLLSVAATAGDWNWPAHYVSALQQYFAADARFNADKAIALPALLMRAGTPAPVAIAIGAAFFAVALPLFARLPLLEAAGLALLAGLAANSHTLPYDLVLMLPALFFMIKNLEEPLRTRLICVLYVAAPFWLLSGILHFDILAVVCDGLAIAWIAKGYYEPAPRTDLNIADSRNRSEA